MQPGTTKWFSDEKGYGFITPADGSPDVFVHYKSIQATGRRTLEAGQHVEFESTNGPKGLFAKSVVPL